ncbi:hypothetical protein [Erwinia tasmaniensis]|uniref:hypothetical protein n=1 Tax=Erwinia tasmaniensis TaxID=338565 RepID=UPI003A4E4728
MREKPQNKVGASVRVLMTFSDGHAGVSPDALKWFFDLKAIKAFAHGHSRLSVA